MKYYVIENLDRYAWIGTPRGPDENETSWWRDGDPQGPAFEHFQTRDFLEWAMAKIGANARPHSILEYGCGTGAAACYLASRGHDVFAVDVMVPAIKLANEIAAEKALTITFEVADICRLPKEVGRKELVIDSFCLQHIVFDEERTRLFANVREHLQCDGYFFVSSVCLDEEHRGFIGDLIPDLDHLPGTYRRYGSGLMEVTKGIVYENACEFTNGHQCPDCIQIHEESYIPYRRYLSPEMLIAEVEEQGFRLHLRDEQFPESFVFQLVN